MMTTTDETTRIENTRKAIASIDHALKDAQESGQPYDAAEMAEISAIRASLEARLQEAEAGR